MVSFAAIESHDFDRLCDAIDAIHASLERENEELRRQLDSLMFESKPMTDENMAESGWVRLPLDADGVPIHIGDKVYHKSFPRGKHRVVCGIGDNSFYYQSGAGFNWFFHADEVSHHAPTVEDVLREFADEMNQNLGMYTGEAIDADEWRDADNKTIAEYAAKLRLAEGEDA